MAVTDKTNLTATHKTTKNCNANKTQHNTMKLKSSLGAFFTICR